MASSVETPAQGLSPGQARPLAADTPMRRPVKDPGPAATAITSTSDSGTPAMSSIPSSMGIRVRLWVRPQCSKFWASSRSSSQSATEQAVAEVSRANIFMLLLPIR